MIEKNHLSSGWTFDETSGVAYHFEHIALAEAEGKAQFREEITVVETINWTFADGKESECHFNKYFSFTMSDAIGLAARFEISASEGVAEEVVAIRSATEEEIGSFLRVYDYYESLMPEAISDEQADELSSE